MDQAARELLLQRRAADELLIEAIFGDVYPPRGDEGSSRTLGVSVDPDSGRQPTGPYGGVIASS